MTIVHLVPVNGARVLDPGTQPPTPLPEEGRKVALSTYWRRRIKEGVVAQPVAKNVTATKNHRQKSGGQRGVTHV